MYWLDLHIIEIIIVVIVGTTAIVVAVGCIVHVDIARNLPLHAIRHTEQIIAMRVAVAHTRRRSGSSSRSRGASDRSQGTTSSRSCRRGSRKNSAWNRCLATAGPSGRRDAIAVVLPDVIVVVAVRAGEAAVQLVDPGLVAAVATWGGIGGLDDGEA